NSSVTSAWNSLQQFGTNKGNSTSTTTGADTTESSQDSMARSKMMNAVDSYAKANHISRDEAFGQLMDKSVRGDVSGEAYVGARGGVGFELFGNGGKAEFGGRMSARGTASSGSQDNTTESGRQSNADNHDTSSQAVKDFRESSDYFINQKSSQSGNITDNNASSRVDQFSASLASAKNSYDQYTTSKTRSHEYSEMASRTESMSGQMNENLTQQFANFVQKNAPQNAEAILTDTSSPEIAAQREQLAREFVKQQVEPKVDEAYQEGRRNIGANMPSVSEGKGSGTVYADYNSHGDSIDEMTKNAGIKNDVHQSVEHMVSENQQAHKDRQDSIHKQEDDVQNEHTRLENHHNLEGNKFEKEYNDKKAEQRALPGADTRDELLAKAQEFERKHKP
ncbi:TPA: conjugal transfer protein TraG, partial [Klebsiella quasipneumoniae]|nr:conjugal transfer protein TraG [Klebsiella quasipneumoniae]